MEFATDIDLIKKEAVKWATESPKYGDPMF